MLYKINKRKINKQFNHGNRSKQTFFIITTGVKQVKANV